jgi:alpha-ketoglutarate-dependent taurine dioxygenase
MEFTKIYESWGTQVSVTFDEFKTAPEGFWRQLLIDRKLLVIRGLTNQLTDAEYHYTGTQFGRVWDRDDYKKTPTDTTVKHVDTTPVSYFKTNNMWGARDMKYHADQAHMGETSFPARSLYMVKTTENNTGRTHWLNLELAWQQFTDAERAAVADVEVVQQYMYEPGTRLETFPFLKISPYSGLPSPRINCYVTPKKNGIAWINHVKKNGQRIADTGAFVEEMYATCESKQDALYSHDWENGDMLVYDNWFSVHRRDPVELGATEGDRLLKRLTFNI